MMLFKLMLRFIFLNSVQCYDLRFPELSVLQTKLGAEILTYPSAFTHSTGEAHWEVLLRARAIENQCYVVAAALYGKHNNKRISYGQAMVNNNLSYRTVHKLCTGVSLHYISLNF